MKTNWLWRGLTITLGCWGLSVLGTGAEAPRAARSVHLGWPAPDSELFLLDMVVEKSTPGSYFMACGWNTGYFGIQELTEPGKKVAIFSVWDPTTGDDPQNVKTEDRVELLHQGDGVRIKRFGGEGTGGQCMTDFEWKPGETNRFMLHAKVEGAKTAYAGYLWAPAEQQWRHLVTFRTRTGGTPLKGLYSFVEDFRRDGASAQDERRARYFNGWVKTTAGEWLSLSRARFTASGAEWESRDNIDAGLTPAGFYLATGGKVRSTRLLRSMIQENPSVADLPAGIPGPWVTVDWTGAPETAPFARKAAAIVNEWYPRLCALLNGPDSQPPYPQVELKFERIDGIAATGGNRITVAAEWVTKKAPDDYGMIVHELVHVVQDYQGKGEGWLTEGIADYLRYHCFEPETHKLAVDPKKCRYTDGYNAAGAFLLWLEQHKNPQIVLLLNRASHDGKYTPELFKQLTGGTPDELWQEFAAGGKAGP